MKEKPSFYAILTADVRYSEKLSSSQKLFFAEITALTQKSGKCWASNKYFSELYSVAKSTVSSWVSALEAEGFIEVEYYRDGKEIKERIIKIPSSKRFKGIQKTEQGSQKSDEVCSENPNGGYSENPKENSTSKSNTTRDNKKEYKPSEKPPEYHIPTVNQAEAYFDHQDEILPDDIPQEALKFCNHYEDAEWKNGRGKRIKNWHLQAGSWAANYKQWNRDRIEKEKSNQLPHQIIV